MLLSSFKKASRSHALKTPVQVTAISRHIWYLLNIGGTFCFSLPEDLTVKDYFYIFIIVPCFYFCREIQDTTARSCACARHETAPLMKNCLSTTMSYLSTFVALEECHDSSVFLYRWLSLSIVCCQKSILSLWLAIFEPAVSKFNILSVRFSVRQNIFLSPQRNTMNSPSN